MTRSERRRSGFGLDGLAAGCPDLNHGAVTPPDEEAEPCRGEGQQKRREWQNTNSVVCKHERIFDRVPRTFIGACSWEKQGFRRTQVSSRCGGTSPPPKKSSIPSSALHLLGLTMMRSVASSAGHDGKKPEPEGRQAHWTSGIMSFKREAPRNSRGFVTKEKVGKSIKRRWTH